MRFFPGQILVHQLKKKCNCLESDRLSAHVQSKNGHMLPMGQSCAPPKVTTWPPCGPKVVSKFSSSCLKVVPIMIQSCLKDVSKLSKSCLEAFPKLSQCDWKVVIKLSQGCHKFAPKVVPLLFPKGRLAIAKLKPLSLFFFLS